MCRQVVAIEAMTTDAATYSVGVIHGGQWVNCVATTCEAESLSMAKRQADLDEAVERMLALRPTGNDVSLEVTRGVTRPVWEPDGKVMALYETARGIARSIGFDITSQSSGGGSDGNFTGAMGIPTLGRPRRAGRRRPHAGGAPAGRQPGAAREAHRRPPAGGVRNRRYPAKAKVPAGSHGPPR